MSFWDVFSSLNPFTAIGSVVSSFVNADAQRDANETNMDINRENNAFNAQQAELSRNWQSNQTQLQNAWNSAEAEKARQQSMEFAREMFDKETSHNSPVNQMKLLREAGLNPNSFQPSVASASGNVPSLSAASGGTASSGGVATSATPLGVNPLRFNNPLLESAEIELAKANALKAGSDTKVNEANISRMNQLLTYELADKQVDIALKQNELDDLRPVQVRKFTHEAENLMKQKDMMDEQINLLRKQFESLDVDIQRKNIENGKLARYLESEIQRNLSQVGLNHAEASYYSEMASKALIEGGISALNFEILDSTKMSVTAKTNEENTRSYVWSSKDLEYQKYVYWMEKAGFIFNGISSAVSSSLKSLPFLFIK